MVVLDFLLLLLYAASTLLSFKEEWYIGELAASLRLHWALGGVVLAFYFGLRRKILLLMAAWALCLYHVPVLVDLMLSKPQEIPKGAYHRVTVFQHNTLRFKDNTDEVMRWMLAHADKYDVVFLQEVSPELNERLNELLPQFPYIIPAYFEQRFDSAVLSKFPVASFEIRMFPDLKIGYIRCLLSLDEQGGSLVMYGMHATAPVSPAYWYARNSQIAHIAHEIAEDGDMPRMLVGDLNLTPYSSVFPGLLESAGLHNSMKGFGLENTWGSFLPMRALGLPIDHLLVSDGVLVRTRAVGPNLGSDHYTVTTELAIPR